MQAASTIYGYAVGIDFTRRDLQATAKANGKPWDTAKGFDASAPISKIKPSGNGELEDGRIWLAVNGETKQDARLSDMIWSVTEIIVDLSRYYELKAGDLIFTGTPAGVSAIGTGDRITAAVENVGEIEFEITAGPSN
jgi:fumarylpyruvate hydrolase